MNFEDFISSTDDPRPRKLVIYGTEAIGKTGFAMRCPFGPTIILPTEDGYQDIRPVAKRLTFNGKRLIESESELLQAISILYTEEHGFGCVVLDSATATEMMLESGVARDAGKDTIGEVGGGFAKGEKKASSKFLQILSGFDALVSKGMFVIVIAHAEVVRFNNPSGDSYDRYSPRLYKETAPVLKEWCDELFFCRQTILTRTVEDGFGKKSAKAVGTSERVICTTAGASHDAKNRLGLPEEIPFPKDSSIPWGIYSAAISSPVSL